MITISRDFSHQKVLKRASPWVIVASALACFSPAKAADFVEATAQFMTIHSDASEITLSERSAGINPTVTDMQSSRSVERDKVDTVQSWDSTVIEGTVGDWLNFSLDRTMPSTYTNWASRGLRASLQGSQLQITSSNDMLRLVAERIGSNATMTCSKTAKSISGSTELTGAYLWLENGTRIPLPEHPEPNQLIELNIQKPDNSVVKIGSMVLNQRIVTSKSIQVSAIVLQLDLGDGKTADLKIGQSEGRVSGCAALTSGAVTLNPLSVINKSNQGTVPISGTCVSGNGDVYISHTTSTGIIAAATSLPCTSEGKFSGSLDASAVASGDVSINAVQLVSDIPDSTFAATLKDVREPVVTISESPVIDANNQTNYSISGQCEVESGTVSVTFTGGTSSVSASATCDAPGQWRLVPGVDISSLPQGLIAISASQTSAAGNTGSGQPSQAPQKLTPNTTPTPGPISPVPAGGFWAGLLVLAAGGRVLHRRQRRR